MEIFAIYLAGPAAFVASAVYSLLLGRLIDVWPVMKRPLLFVSIAVVALIVFEAATVLMLHPTPSARSIGMPLYAAHLLLFVLGVPALANLLVVGPFGSRTGKWYVVAPVCALFAMAITVMQYVVSEAVFGIE